MSGERKSIPSKAERKPRNNAAVAATMAVVVVGMVGLSFAAVPLYQLFCQVTGFGGTTQVAEKAPGSVGDRTFTIQFNADIEPSLPWRFEAPSEKVTIKAGEQRLINYHSANLADQAITGTAVFNVTPAKAGQYFNKTQCFCFNEQMLEPGEKAEMPVAFFVDPAILDDPGVKDVTTITLSYTFFRAPGDEPANDATAGAGAHGGHGDGGGAAKVSLN